MADLFSLLAENDCEITSSNIPQIKRGFGYLTLYIIYLKQQRIAKPSLNHWRRAILLTNMPF
jgi:hypothetical protein